MWVCLNYCAAGFQKGTFPTFCLSLFPSLPQAFFPFFLLPFPFSSSFPLLPLENPSLFISQFSFPSLPGEGKGGTFPSPFLPYPFESLVWVNLLKQLKTELNTAWFFSFVALFLFRLVDIQTRKKKTSVRGRNRIAIKTRDSQTHKIGIESVDSQKSDWFFVIG